jgi:hypothetical protein
MEIFEGIEGGVATVRVFAKGGVCVVIKSAATKAVARFDHASVRRSDVHVEGSGISLLIRSNDAPVRRLLLTSTASCARVVELMVQLGARATASSTAVEATTMGVAGGAASVTAAPATPLPAKELLLLRELLFDTSFAAELRHAAEGIEYSDSATRALLLDPSFEDYAQRVACALGDRARGGFLGAVPPTAAERIDRGCIGQLFQLAAGAAASAAAAATAPAAAAAMDVECV